LTAFGNKIIQQYVAIKRCNLGTSREKYSHLSVSFFTTILPAIKGFGFVKYLGSRIIGKCWFNVSRM
jgi:hypothetical protein